MYVSSPSLALAHPVRSDPYSRESSFLATRSASAPMLNLSGSVLASFIRLESSYLCVVSFIVDILLAQFRLMLARKNLNSGLPKL